MDDLNKLILTQLERTQESNEAMTGQFTALTGEIGSLRSEVSNQSESVEALGQRVGSIESTMSARAENTAAMSTAVSFIKKDQARLERRQTALEAKHSAINLKTLEGWKQIAPYLVLGLVGLLGLLRDKLPGFVEALSKFAN
jgi:chromosome segregation ATPase